MEGRWLPLLKRVSKLGRCVSRIHAAHSSGISVRGMTKLLAAIRVPMLCLALLALCLPCDGKVGSHWKTLAQQICRHYVKEGHHLRCSSSPRIKTGYYLNEVHSGATLKKKFDSAALTAWVTANSEKDEVGSWSNLQFFGPNFLELDSFKRRGRTDWTLFKQLYPDLDGYIQLTPLGVSGPHCIVYADSFYPSGGKGELFQYNLNSLELERHSVMVTRDMH